MISMLRGSLAPILKAAVIGGAITMGAGQAHAVTFGSVADPASARAASAEFVISGDVLTITLANAGTGDARSRTDVLTGLFFEISMASGTRLRPVSAMLAGGSSVIYDPDGQPVDGDVGGEWAFKGNLSGAPGAATNGLSAASLRGLFRRANFSGPNLSGDTRVGGIDYGLLSTADNEATGRALAASGGLIKNAVVFTLIGASNIVSEITNVSFQYGHRTSGPNLAGQANLATSRVGATVPLPAALPLLAAALGVFGLLGYRRRRSGI